jgi:monoamine oxidase
MAGGAAIAVCARFSICTMPRGALLEIEWKPLVFASAMARENPAKMLQQGRICLMSALAGLP